MAKLFPADIESVSPQQWITDAALMHWFDSIRERLEAETECMKRTVAVINPSVVEVVRQTSASHLATFGLDLNKRHLIFVPVADDAHVGGSHWYMLVIFNIFRFKEKRLLMSLLQDLCKDPDSRVRKSKHRLRRIRSASLRSSFDDILGVVFDSQRVSPLPADLQGLYCRLCSCIAHERSVSRRIRYGPLTSSYVSQQGNTYDCGIFLLIFAEHLLKWHIRYLHRMSCSSSLDELRASLEQINEELLWSLRSIDNETCKRKRVAVRRFCETMVQFDQLAKERLIEATTPQTFGRLLLKVVDHAHSSLLALQGNQIDATDSRFYLYEWAREYRELLLQILIFGKFQRMLPTIDTVVHVTNNVSMIREDVRKRGMELFEAQWPPLGTLPTPVPIYAVDVAADILSCGTYLRLPELTTLAVKQTDSLNVSTNVDLSPAEKEAVLTRVSEESRLNWLLSEVPKDKVTFRMLNDRFEVEILHEIRVHIIDDFSTWQMVDCEPLIGRVLGSEASAAARLGIENSLKTALNFHHAKIELFDTLGKMRLSHMSEELKTAEDRLQLLEGTALTPFRALQVAEEDSDLSHEQEVHLLSEEISRLHREMREDAEEFAGVHMRLDWFLVIYNEGHRLMSRVAVEWLRNLAETVSGVYGYPGGVAGVYFRTLKGPTIEDLTENPVNSDRLGSRGLPSIRRCASIINYENRNRLEQLSVLDIEILTEFDTTLSLVDSCGLGWTPPALIDDNELYESFFHRPLLETVDSATHLTPKYVRQARNPCLRFLMNRMTGDVHVSLWPITQWLEQVDELPDTLAATLRLLEQTPQWQALSHFDCSRLDLSYWTSLVHSTMSFLLVCGGVHLWSVGTTLGLTSFDVMSTRDSISLQALQLWQQNVECPVLHPLVFGIDPPAVYSLILRIDDLRIDVALCPWSGKPSLEFRYDRSGWMNECTRLFDALSKATLDLRSLSVLLPAFCRALDQESFYRCVPLSYVTCADPNETAVLNESFGLPEESEDRPVEDSALAAQEATEEADHHDLHLDYYRRIQLRMEAEAEMTASLQSDAKIALVSARNSFCGTKTKAYFWVDVGCDDTKTVNLGRLALLHVTREFRSQQSLCTEITLHVPSFRPLTLTHERVDRESVVNSAAWPGELEPDSPHWERTMTMMLRTLATKSPPFALLPLQGGDPWKAVADFVDLDVLTPLSRLAKEVCCVYPADDFWTESMGRMRQSRSGVTHTNTPRISRRTAPVIPCVSEVFPFIVVEATLGLSRLDLLLEGYGDSGPVHGRFPAYVQFSGDAVSSVTLTWTSANCLLPSVTPSADEYEIGPGVRLTWRTASIIDNSAEIVELSLVVQAGPVPNTSQWLDLLKSKGITDQPDNSDLFMCLTLRRAVYWTVKWLDMLNRSSQLEKCGQVQVVSRSFGRLEVAWRPPDLHVFTNRPPILLELTSAAQVYVAPPPVVCFPFHVPVPYTFLDLASETPFKRSLNLEQSKLPWTPLLPTVPGTSPAQVARLLGIEPGKNRGLYQWRLDFVVWRIAEWPVVLSEKHSQHLNCITNTKGSFWAGFSHLAMTYELHSSIHQSTTVSPEYVTTRQRFLGHLAGSAFSAELGRALLILNLSTFLSAQILLLFHSLPASGGLETAVTVYVLPKTGAMGERQEQLLSILKTLARHLSWRPNTDGPIRGHQAKDATCSVLIPPGCLYRDFMFEFFSALTTWFNAVMLSTYEGHWKSPTDLVIDGHCPLSVELKHFAAAYPTTTDWPTAKNDTPEEDAPFSQHAREMWLVSGLNLIHSMMTASAATSSSSAVSSWGDKPSVVNLSREPPGFFIYELINPTNPSTGTPASKRRRVTALPPLLPLCAVKGGQRFLLAPYLGLQFRCERQEAYVLTALQYFSMLHHRLPRGDFRLLPRLMCHHPQMMEALRPVLDMNLRSFLAHKDYIVNSHTGAEATQPSCPFIELQTDDGDQADKMELLMKGVTSSPCSLTLVEVRIWAMAPFQAAKTDKTFSRLPLRLSLAQTHNGLGIDSVEVCGVSLKTYLERFGASLTKPLDSLCEVFLDASKVSEALTLLASMVTK